MSTRRIGSFLNLSPLQEISINPFSELNSDSINKLTKSISNGEDGVVFGLDVINPNWYTDSLQHFDVDNGIDGNWSYDSTYCTPVLKSEKVNGFTFHDVTKCMTLTVTHRIQLAALNLQNLKGKNVEELIKAIKKHLPDNIKYFNDDVITNVDEAFMVGEIIREKVLQLTKEEVPHAVTCVVEQIEFKKGLCNINALIIVDRQNLKGIIIGKNGSMLKKIGSLAREDIENLLGMKVYLELYVKTIENWKNKEEIFEYLKINEKDL